MNGYEENCKNSMLKAVEQMYLKKTHIYRCFAFCNQNSVDSLNLTQMVASYEHDNPIQQA